MLERLNAEIGILQQSLQWSAIHQIECGPPTDNSSRFFDFAPRKWHAKTATFLATVLGFTHNIRAVADNDTFELNSSIKRWLICRFFYHLSGLALQQNSGFAHLAIIALNGLPIG